MGKLIDFDQFMQEHDKRTMDVIVFGDKYTVAMEIPAIVPIMMARAEEALSPADSARMVMRAADTMFGVEGVNQMCRKGMTAQNLASLIERLFKEINAPSDDDEEAQEVTDEDSRVQVKSKREKK